MSSSRYYKKRRRRRRRRYTRRINPLIIIIPVIILVAAVVLIVTLTRNTDNSVMRYLGSTNAGVAYYSYDETEQRLIKASGTLQRGIQVKDLNQEYTENGVTYTIIEYNGENYYISRSALVDSMDDVVQETELWVRTSATVYTNESGPEIASFAKKGSCLTVIGYDELQSDGSVYKYEVSFTDSTGKDVTGWVYGKYLKDNEEDALAINEEVYAIHKDRIYSGLDLGGGLPSSLDWYPVEKPSFADNPICEFARGMYITVDGVQYIDAYIAIAKENGVNCLVIDIKDGTLAYKVESIKDISPTSYNNAYFANADDYAAAIQKCKDEGFYVIGRIVAFNDTLYAADHPETCIESESSTQLWPSGYSRDCWYYNLLLATDAVERCGFNEIQFDYVRFPEESYSMSQDPTSDFKDTYGEDKVEAIQNFCYYAADVLHELGVYVSADVFGECVYKYITAYGQYMPAIALVVDAVSAMPYTDHFGTDTDTWSDPYTTLYDWGLSCVARLNETPNAAIARTWITCYNVPWWNPTVTCDADYVAKQVQGLVDAGLTGGFLTWNGVANRTKYEEMGAAWGYDYVPSTATETEEE